jgi:pimeloyl-ACP methyl ester carboxylesterase
MTPLSASSVPTQLADINNHSIAYRSLGSGMPLILCNRLRGTLDSWDPAFLDTLGEHFRVVIFDYSGTGESTGVPNLCIKYLTRDIIDLADALGIDIFVAAGWSAGALAVESLSMSYPDRVSRIVLLSALPLTQATRLQRRALYKQALLFDNDPDHEMALFFGSHSENTRMAAEACYSRMGYRAADQSRTTSETEYKKLLKAAVRHRSFMEDEKIESFLETTEIPILVISGDRDIISSVRNWFRYLGVWNSLHLIVIPQSGHAPHHREPLLCANVIASFVMSVD